MKNAAMVAALGFLLLLASAPDAHAYLDPGTGSFLLQVLIGGIAGSLVTVKLYWAKVKAFFANGRRSAVDSKNAS
jgi:hypothetical protein